MISKIFRISMFLGFCLLTLPVLSQKKAALIGDSTMASYSSGAKQGWGRHFAAQFSKLSVSNFARGGRSSKTFYQGDEWDRALASKANYLFIQFGHNDSHKGEPEYTDPKSSYRTYLTRFINESRKKGMTPVLVTPVRRARFSGSSPTSELSPYASAMKEVAKKERVPLIDLHAISGAQYKKMGKTKTLKYFAKGDTTHFNDSGAKLVASWVAEEAVRVIPSFPSRK